MAFIRAHFEINRCIRNLKADLGVILPPTLRRLLIADFEPLEMNPGGGWMGIPQGEASYTKILQDEKALDPSLKFKPVTRKKFHRDEKALDAAIQGWYDPNA